MLVQTETLVADKCGCERPPSRLGRVSQPNPLHMPIRQPLRRSALNALLDVYTRAYHNHVVCLVPSRATLPAPMRL